MSMTDGLSEDEKLLYSIFGRFLPRKGVCYLCYPDHEDKLLIESGLRNWDGTWKDENGKTIRWCKEIHKKYMDFKKDFEKDKISTIIDIDSELQFTVCKKHLLKMVKSIEDFDKNENTRDN